MATTTSPKSTPKKATATKTPRAKKVTDKRTCPECKRTLPLSEFYIRPNGVPGYCKTPSCLETRRARWAANRAARKAAAEQPQPKTTSKPKTTSASRAAAKKV